MDLAQIISYLESLDSPTLNTDYALQSDTSAVPPLPQPSYPNETLSLLDTFCSDADTVQSNLLDIDEFNNQSNEGQQFFDSSIENWFNSNDCNNPSDSLYAIESINSSTLDTDHSSQCDTLAVQPLPRPSYPKRSLALLKAFCSDEDTVKIYLQNDDLNNYNNEGQQFFTSIGNLDSCIQNWSNFTDTNKPSDRMSINENLFPAPISSYLSTDPLAVDSLLLYPKYNDLKLNFIFLIKHGYKLTLSLNTDNSTIDEPWNPDVGQKILSAYFSSLSLRNDYLSNEAKLNGFQSLLMNEASSAFKGRKCLNLFANIDDRRRSKARPDKLISICNGINGFRKIETIDKMILLSNIYYHLHLMDGAINYDPTIDGWDYPASDVKYDRRDTFLFSQSFHDGLNYVIETFPDRFRNDINAIILMYLIVIFNGDITGLKHPEMIRYEQFSYIYLLRRYLRTICESDCEASDNFYRLMVKTEQMRLLARKVKKDFLLLLNEPLVETITKSIKLRVPKIIPQILQVQHMNILI
ncbi:uncharacterized protein LOC107370425 isoform X3 [Tetranychus urticae]|uniref:uncharacterized protein LOC107370425 isoform X3 n=1 Tax=Tetranychus urticae TaxID=32264 RepID=UPI000D648540|nr:uncharacterized protein LOC107370425 isoform X3 [Tetranychus urticae]